MVIWKSWAVICRLNRRNDLVWISYVMQNRYVILPCIIVPTGCFVWERFFQTLERPTPIVGHRSDDCKQGLLISLSPQVVWFSAWMRSISPRYGFLAGSWVHKRAWNAPERHVLRRRIWLAWHAWAWIASSRRYTWAWLALSKHCVCWNSQLNLFESPCSCMFQCKYK